MEQVKRWLASAQRIAVLTGAGVSAESGVPTFRAAGALAKDLPDPKPLWTRYRPEELATPGAFKHDPALVWRWYAWRRELVRACAPNPGHEALARAFARWRQDGRRATLITQNVDGLHHVAERAAGLEGAGPLELHGSLFFNRCTGCDREAWEDREPLAITGPSDLPRCPDCGELARPHVVWFGEALDARILREAQARAEEADVILVIGTSAHVQPAAGLALLTRQAGGHVVEVNPHATPLSDACDAVLREPAGELLPRLLG